MTPIRQLARVIRSKNCSPFELTLDIIFNDWSDYDRIKANNLLNAEHIAAAYAIPVQTIQAFIYFDPAKAIKVVMARTNSSGSPGDSDVYGAQQHGPLLNISIDL